MPVVAPLSRAQGEDVGEADIRAAQRLGVRAFLVQPLAQLRGAVLRQRQVDSIVAVRLQLCNRSRYSSAGSNGQTITTARPLLWASNMILNDFRMPRPGTDRIRERTTWSIELTSSLCRITAYGSRARERVRCSWPSRGIVAGPGDVAMAIPIVPVDGPPDLLHQATPSP
jgi:hypothetical protein